MRPILPPRMGQIRDARGQGCDAKTKSLRSQGVPPVEQMLLDLQSHQIGDHMAHERFRPGLAYLPSRGGLSQQLLAAAFPLNRSAIQPAPASALS